MPKVGKSATDLLVNPLIQAGPPVEAGVRHLFKIGK